MVKEKDEKKEGRGERQSIKVEGSGLCGKGVRSFHVLIAWSKASREKK